MFETYQLNCKILPEPHKAKSTGSCDDKREKYSAVREGADLFPQPDKKNHKKVGKSSNNYSNPIFQSPSMKFFSFFAHF